MPAGELYINGQDAYTTWGISLDRTGLSALMTPAGQKDVIENESRLENGRRVLVTSPRMAARDISIVLNMCAHTQEDFMTQYSSFCVQLQTGKLVIRTKYQPTTYYKFIYRSCTQFSQTQRELAKFVLRLTESNPGDRTQPT